MSSVIIELPDEGWFLAGGNTRPVDKQLCICIMRYGAQSPDIMQYRKADWLHKENDYFLEVSEKWRLDAYGCGDEWSPGFATMNIIDRWKPLGLPIEVNDRILKKIESWFDE